MGKRRKKSVPTQQDETLVEAKKQQLRDDVEKALKSYNIIDEHPQVALDVLNTIINLIQKEIDKKVKQDIDVKLEWSDDIKKNDTNKPLLDIDIDFNSGLK